MTNAERIRAMTEFRHRGLIGIFESGDYWLDWLRQEVNE